MASREEILRALREAAPPEEPLPDLRALGAPAADLRARFEQSVVEVGGRCVRAVGSLDDALRAIPEFAAARKIASLVPGVARANVDVESTADPHALDDVDFAVLPGELGVAENGAVWITHHGQANRAVCFLAQHLAIVLQQDALVADLHEAYARVAIPRPGFSMWLSGPSKTADIEQALVIGAHGARSCTVILVG